MTYDVQTSILLPMSEDQTRYAPGRVRDAILQVLTLTSEALTEAQREELRTFFFIWARLLLPKLVPGANVIVASNPLLSFIVSGALADAGLERRGEIHRYVRLGSYPENWGSGIDGMPEHGFGE